MQDLPRSGDVITLNDGELTGVLLGATGKIAESEDQVPVQEKQDDTKDHDQNQGKYD